MVCRLLTGLLCQPRMTADECEAVVGMRIGRGTKDLGKTCPSATLSTTNPTRPDLNSNPSRCGGNPVTNLLSYGTACLLGLVLGAKYAGSAFLRNIVEVVQEYKASHTRK
jgi:hypothetical protein